MHLFCKRWRLNELRRVMYTNLIQIRYLVLFCIWRYNNILWHPVWGHIRVHIFNEPISDELTKSVVIKTKHMQNICRPVGQYILLSILSLFQQFFYWNCFDGVVFWFLFRFLFLFCFVFFIYLIIDHLF